MSNDTLATDLMGALAADGDIDLSVLPELRDRLVDDADAAGLVDVAYATIDSPAGRLLLAATTDGLVKIAFAGIESEAAVLADLADRISPRLLCRPQRLDGVIRQLDDYFAGRRRDFELPLDLRLAHGFRRTVLDELCAVGYGTTVSYTQLATAAGRPAPCAPPGRRAPPTRSRSSSRATVCCAATGRWAVTAVGCRRSAHCSTWSSAPPDRRASPSASRDRRSGARRSERVSAGRPCPASRAERACGSPATRISGEERSLRSERAHRHHAIDGLAHDAVSV